MNGSTINDILLLVAALLPAVVLCVYIFKKDSVEKEPFSLLALLLFLGVLICIPVGWGETLAYKILDSIFSKYSSMEGALYLSTDKYHLYLILKYFLGVALVEEGCKWIAVWVSTHKNKNFNSYFDGVIYAAYVSLGFAAAENIKYVFQYGWGTALIRTVTAVPAHTFCAVIMGYFYTRWHMYEKANEREEQLIQEDVIQDPDFPFWSKGQLILSILIPTLAHGCYDYLASVGKVWSEVFFYLFLIFLYIYCFRKVHKMSEEDSLDMALADAMVLRKYPKLRSYFVSGTVEPVDKDDWKKKYLEEEYNEEEEKDSMKEMMEEAQETSKSTIL